MHRLSRRSSGLAVFVQHRIQIQCGAGAMTTECFFDDPSNRGKRDLTLQKRSNGNLVRRIEDHGICLPQLESLSSEA